MTKWKREWCGFGSVVKNPRVTNRSRQQLWFCSYNRKKRYFFKRKCRTISDMCRIRATRETTWHQKLYAFLHAQKIENSSLSLFLSMPKISSFVCQLCLSYLQCQTINLSWRYDAKLKVINCSRSPDSQTSSTGVGLYVPGSFTAKQKNRPSVITASLAANFDNSILQVRNRYKEKMVMVLSGFGRGVRFENIFNFTKLAKNKLS